MNILAGMLFVTVVLSSTGCAYLQTQNPCADLPAIPDAPASSVPEQTFLSLEGRFRIGLPPRAAEQAESSEGSKGSIETTSYKWIVMNHGQYQVKYSDSDRNLENAADSERIFNNVRDLLVSKGPGHVQSDQALTLAGHPGREIRIKDENGINIHRFYLVELRLYTVSVFVPSKLECALESAVKVLDSFELVENKA